MKLFGKKKKTGIPESKIFEAETIRAVDIVAPSSIEIKTNYLKLGERLVQSYFIFSYPRYLTTGWFSPIINLDIAMDISFFIHPIEAGLILKQLRKRVTEIQAELMERESKGLVRDPVLETAFRDIEELRDRLQTAQERMFTLGLYLTVYADEEKELDAIETSLRSMLESKLIYIKPSLYQQKEGFASTSPYGMDQLGVNVSMNTGPLSSIFPFISFDLSSNEGILYGINQHNNSLVLFDRFSLPNANMVIFAQSGAGKSILGSEPVLIKNDGRVKLTNIGPLVEKCIKKQGLTQIDDELEGALNPNLEVYSFDKNLKGRWSKVTVAARKKAPDIFYKFTTRSGREITTTGDHNMLVLKQGRVVAAKSSGVKEGEYVPLPRRIEAAQNTPDNFNLLELLKDKTGIYIKNGETVILEHYQKLLKTELDKNLDRYLYEYRNGRVVPIKYFWKILNYLGINTSNRKLQQLKVVSKNGDRKYALGTDFPISNEFLRLAGYICAEGTVRNEVIMISNTDPEVIKNIDYCLKKLGMPFYHGNRGVIIAFRVFIEIIKTLGGKNKSGDKRVLPLIFGLGEEKIAQYLTAYFEGDGGVEHSSVTAVSKSKKLVSDIAYLLSYFGIVGRLAQTRKMATNSNWKHKRTYYKITISGQDSLRKFAEKINFISEKKRGDLSQIIKKQGNTNVDIVPEIHGILKEIYQLFPPLFYEIADISALKNGRGNPSAQHLCRVINTAEEKIQYFKNLAPTFKILQELPSLATIIDLGRNNENFNRALWQELGQSWRVVKNCGVKPGSVNMLRALSIINGKPCSLEEIKTAIHVGFQEMNLSIKHYNLSLQPALTVRLEKNTDYEMIQESAKFVWQNYQETLNQKIPQIEERLAQLKILANSDLFWDPIIKIKEIQNKKEKYVYDLTVNDEVFLAGQGGMFIHNSYAVKLELLRSLMLGTDCIVVDPENEYEALSGAVGGSYFKMSLASPSRINPFDLPIPREDEKPEDVLRSNIINLVGLMRLMLGGLTPEEDAIMDRALTETYAAKDITPQSDFSKAEPPLMSDLEAVLNTMEGAESLLKRVRKYTKGTYANFFNKPSTVKMDNAFVVFGIRDMEEGLRPMAMYIITRYIWNKIRSELKKRILVVDEAWWLMHSEDGASFLFGLVKRARKYWLGVTTITQDVSDFMKSEYGQPIITNSSLQFLMKQSPATASVVQKTFNLTDWEKELLTGAAVGEGLFFAGPKHVALKVVASPAEDRFVTTAPEEIKRMAEEKKAANPV